MKPLTFVYEPRNAGQFQLAAQWASSAIVVLLGPAGTGKTTAALGESWKQPGKIRLARPTVSCEEDLGFEPGDMNAKLGSWMGAFEDVLDGISDTNLAHLMDTKRVELLSVGRLRGRTIRGGTLIVDEAQNCTYNQLKLIVTRIGPRGKIVLCGDESQSDIRNSGLLELADRIEGIPSVSVIRFEPTDQQRSPLITRLLEVL